MGDNDISHFVVDCKDLPENHEKQQGDKSNSIKNERDDRDKNANIDNNGDTKDKHAEIEDETDTLDKDTIVFLRKRSRPNILKFLGRLDTLLNPPERCEEDDTEEEGSVTSTEYKEYDTEEEGSVASTELSSGDEDENEEYVEEEEQAREREVVREKESERSATRTVQDHIANAKLQGRNVKRNAANCGKKKHAQKRRKPTFCSRPKKRVCRR